MSVTAKPGKLIMPELHGNGSQDSLDKTSPNSLDSGSPHRSWQDTLDQLSVGLQRICKSPVREGTRTPPLNGSPLLKRSLSPLIGKEVSNVTPGTVSPQHQNGLLMRNLVKREGAAQKRYSENMVAYSHRPPTLLIHDMSEDKLVIRVRHEESTRLLQKQLALISGYQSEEEISFSHPSKELAAKITKRRASSVSRFRKSLDVNDCKHDELVIEYQDNELHVIKVTKEGQKTIKTVTVPKSLNLQRLVCTLHEDTLVIAEHPKKVIYVESSYATFFEHYYCPVVAEDVRNDTWKLVWHVPKEFQSHEVMVKTVDDKLELHCRQRNTSSSDVPSGSPSETKPVAKQLMIRIDLPENVEPKSVSAIMCCETSQLIIQGTSSWRSRCVTY